MMGAFYEGGMKGTKIIVQVFVNLLIFLSAFKFVDSTMIWFGQRAGIDDFSLEVLCMK